MSLAGYVALDCGVLTCVTVVSLKRPDTLKTSFISVHLSPPVYVLLQIICHLPVSFCSFSADLSFFPRNSQVLFLPSSPLFVRGAQMLFCSSPTGLLSLFGLFRHRPAQRSALRDIAAGKQAQSGGCECVFLKACVCMDTTQNMMYSSVCVCVCVCVCRYCWTWPV